MTVSPTARNGPICNATSTDKDCEMGQWTGPEWPTGNCGGGGTPTVCPHVCSAATNCTQVPPAPCPPTPTHTHPPTHRMLRTRQAASFAARNLNKC